MIEKMNVQAMPISLDLRKIKFYALTSLFVAGNILLPIALHLVPNGGKIFLPIYFFTLIGSYAFGWRMGVIIALFSPLLNNLITGMPDGKMLTIVTINSLILTLITWIVSQKNKKLSLQNITLAVVSYQLAGLFIQYIFFKNITIISHNLTTQIPGLFFQIFFGYFILKTINRYQNGD